MKIADRPLTLAAALEQAAEAIQHNPSIYNWKDAQSCNCGILAQVITGKTRGEIGLGLPHRSKSGNSSQWTDIEKYNCPITGMPQNAILAALRKAGCQFGDLNRLEYLRTEEILRRAGLVRRKGIVGFRKEVVDRDWADRDHVIAYMRAWAAMIREYRAENDAPSVPLTAAESAAVDKVLENVPST